MNKSFEVTTERLVSPCCPDDVVSKKRVVFSNVSGKRMNAIRGIRAKSPNIITFKALMKRNKGTRRYETKRVGTVGANTRFWQAAQAAGSYVLPGDISPLRSPLRSGLYTALTPGVPGIGGGLRRAASRVAGRDGVYRCPEGYQFGGRFTDNRFSTCGQKLFQIPGPLGLAISLIRRAIRASQPAPRVEGQTLGAGEYPESIGISRKPQIPKVSLSNPSKLRAEIDKLIKPLSAAEPNTARMVRRDGFVLEPVVPPSVLRTIPDNRDMEGATYLANFYKPNDIGKEELGLLSNTGVQSVKYVLPDGSVLTIEKKRPLTVGERRKLGRTVNAAIASSNDNDPASRLKLVAQEMGDGIGYSEQFNQIKNPNEIVTDKNGSKKPRWATVVFSKKRRPKPAQDIQDERGEQAAPQTVNIDTVEGAIRHIENGGSLAEIAPDILQKALAESNKLKRRKINNRETIIEASNTQKFILRSNSRKFEALSQDFTASVQEFLGLIAPEIVYLGTGDKRDYLVRDPGSVFQNSTINRAVKMGDISPAEVARLMVSDLLTDTRSRNVGNLLTLSSEAGPRLVALENTGAGLIDLSDIEITKRTNAAIGDMYRPSDSQLYKEYFAKLQKLQQNQFRQFIATLIRRARAFNFTDFRSRLYTDGKLSQGEKIHLNILEKLFNQRINNLSKAQMAVMENIS